VVAGLRLNVGLMWKRWTRPRGARSTRRRCRCSRGTAAQILATAGRYAATPEDAEDAYQRPFEILLTKAPIVRENKHIHWLDTVKLLQRARHQYRAGAGSQTGMSGAGLPN
jgi:hypothetical protein